MRWWKNENKESYIISILYVTLDSHLLCIKFLTVDVIKSGLSADDELDWVVS